MVNEEVKWVLTHTKIDPLKVATAFGVPEQECWEYLEELNIALSEAEVTRRETAEQRRLDVQAFIDEMPDAKETKRQVVLERLYEAKRNPNAYNVSKLLSEAKSLSIPESTKVTPQDIVRAKNSPITTLLGVHRVGNISCPLHEDRTPSFQIKKNNTFNCYSCGEHGDVIDLYQKLHHCDFPTAVKALT